MSCWSIIYRLCVRWYSVVTCFMWPGLHIWFDTFILYLRIFFCIYACADDVWANLPLLNNVLALTTILLCLFLWPLKLNLTAWERPRIHSFSWVRETCGSVTNDYVPFPLSSFMITMLLPFLGCFACSCFVLCFFCILSCHPTYPISHPVFM